MAEIRLELKEKASLDLSYISAVSLPMFLLEDKHFSFITLHPLVLIL